MDQSDVKLKQEIESVLATCLPQYTSKEFQLGRLCGMTNETFKLIFNGLKPLVFRKLSSVINRKIEGAIIQELSRRKIAPYCHFTSLDYRVEEYIQNASHPYCFDILVTQGILKAIVQKMAEFHKTEMPPTIPTDLLAEAIFSKQNEEKYLATTAHVSYNKEEFEKLKERIMKQYDNMKEWLVKNFGQRPDIIHFCHNDLNPLNIFIKNTNQNKKQAIFIDFEYASFNYAPYDIANFMNETTFQYGNQIPGFKLGKRIQLRDIEKVCEYYELRYEGIEKDVGKMLMLVNYYWALWSLKTKPTQSSPNFSPLKHGIARMDLFDHYKSQYDN